MSSRKAFEIGLKLLGVWFLANAIVETSRTFVQWYPHRTLFERMEYYMGGWRYFVKDYAVAFSELALGPDQA